MSSSNHTRHPLAMHRNGLSILEFSSCIAAMFGGLAIGSNYLGVDMKTLVVGILEQAEVVQPGFFSEGDNDTSELGGIETTDALATDDPATGATPASIVAPTFSESEIEAASILYWNGLRAGVRREFANRTSINGKRAKWELYDYLSHRAKNHEAVVGAVDALEEDAVDPRLIAHGKQVREWHEAGAELYREAIGLLTDAAPEQLTGPMGEDWQSVATQHRMEEKLVRDHHTSITRYLNHRFPKLAPFRPAL